MKSARKPTHIVVAHLADGVKVTEHPSKIEACRVGMAHRKAGVDAFVYGIEFAAKFGLDPRAPVVSRMTPDPDVVSRDTPGANGGDR